jgi:5-methylcytosine-specific restriction endonuclease McrA
MAVELASVGSDLIRCAVCLQLLPKGLKIRGRKMWQVDHVDPVGAGPVTTHGFAGWDEYYRRLFCPVSNLQVLCTVCHQIKTNKENAARRKKKPS